MNKEKVGFARFKKFGDKFLVTNDVGRYAILNQKDFQSFIDGKLTKSSKTYKDLQKKFFIKDDLDEEKLIDIYRQRNAFLFHGTSLHIIVGTLRCNFNCIYCQASSRNINAKGFGRQNPSKEPWLED